MDQEESPFYKVCVTGGSGFIGSSLVKKLLQRGHTVHVTTQNLGDESKLKVLKSLPNAETNLVLFQANIYNPDEFGPVIEGCHYVFHLATPRQPIPAASLYNDTTEAAVAGVRTIAELCTRSPTVKRLIYSGSVMAASPFKEDGSGYKACYDESCWTPLHLPYSSINNDLLAYVSSKTLSEKEILSYNDNDSCGGLELEVVSLICGLVGGDVKMLAYAPGSVRAVVGQLTGDPFCFLGIKLIQELLGSVPLIHIEDVCEALIFCMDQSSMKGRFMCAAVDPTMAEMAFYFQHKNPKLNIQDGLTVQAGKGSYCDMSKLKNMGFTYRYGMDDILNDSINCVTQLGLLPL